MPRSKKPTVSREDVKTRFGRVAAQPQGQSPRYQTNSGRQRLKLRGGKA